MTLYILRILKVAKHTLFYMARLKHKKNASNYQLQADKQWN